MTLLKTTLSSLTIAFTLIACSEGPKAVSDKVEAENAQDAVQTLRWEDLLPEGEDEILAALYSDFYKDQEKQLREQMPLSQAAKAEVDIMSLVEEGSADDTMEQIGTYNVVEDLNGARVRLPGYVVPLDFNAESEYDEFLLVPYFGACLHTPPPPPNQIIFVTSSPAQKIGDIYEPVWVEGVMKTGQFGSDLGNSAYELTLSKLEPYDY